MASYDSLPFEIRLQIAETNPETFCKLRSIDRQILNYTDERVETYKLRFGTFFKGSGHGYVFAPNGRIHSRNYQCRKVSKTQKTYLVEYRQYPNRNYSHLSLIKDNEIFKSSFIGNKMHGSYFYRKNSVEVRCNFNMGKIHGTYVELSNNKIHKIYQYYDGILSGHCQQWCTKDQQYFLQYECNYIDGQIQNFKEWNSEYKVAEIIYVDGERARSRKWKKGILKAEFNVLNGQFHGKLFFDDMMLTEEATFYHGKIHGSYFIKDRCMSSSKEFIFHHGILIREKINAHDKISQSYYLHHLNSIHALNLNLLRSRSVNDIDMKIFMPLHDIGFYDRINEASTNVLHDFSRYVSLTFCSTLQKPMKVLYNFWTWVNSGLSYIDMLDTPDSEKSGIIKCSGLFEYISKQSQCEEPADDKNSKRKRYPDVHIKTKKERKFTQIYNKSLNNRKQRTLKQC